MLFLLLILAISTMALMVVFSVVTLFLQGYYYTEPTPGIAWQAPLAGGILGLFFMLWCWLIVFSSEVSPGSLPYDTLMRFSPKVDMTKEPVKELWAVRKGHDKDSDEPIHYQLKKFPKDQYVEANLSKRPWPYKKVEAILSKKGPKTYRFVWQPTSDDRPYQEYRDESGWVMRVFAESGPTGRPYSFRWGRFLGNLFLNFFHLVLWFICFWLVLRFQWGHALGLALVGWLITTLAILPLLLEQAGSRAMVP